jgi:RHS repeat-associated protein
MTVFAASDGAPGGPAGPAAALAPPAIAAPKGGGAIRGIGEKFTVNAVNGSCTISVPLALSPGRSGTGPTLSLTYDSAAGNGPFGFGWQLGLPAITRRTDRGLPRYRDAEESDTFLMSDAEDLVCVLDDRGRRVVDRTSVPGYDIQLYLPRVEGLFARIERWTWRGTGETHWRTISRDDVTTVYGRNGDSRIAERANASADRAARTFAWLICESYDDKGNATVYEYVPEDDANVDLSRAGEGGRTRTANRYLKRILYGNRVSRLTRPDLSAADWMFEVVLDYDEGHYLDKQGTVRATHQPRYHWSVRPDSFSSYRSGFEVRTHRRCHRVLMFHRFPELGAEPTLVRTMAFRYEDLDYSAGPVPAGTELSHQGSTRLGSFLREVAQLGHVRRPDGTYRTESLPPVTFTYSRAEIDPRVRPLPAAVDSARRPQWIDLDGTGIPGILAEATDAWTYRPSLGGGRYGPARPVTPRPSPVGTGDERQQLLDLAGDGQLDLVSFAGPTPGFYEHDATRTGWAAFRPFICVPNLRWDDPNLRFADLSGDGRADALLTDHDVMTWYPSLAEAGFDAARQVRDGPRVVFADGTQTVHVADMSGDGLGDLVRIRNGEVCYWPNLGHGRFGAAVTMGRAPRFDHADLFNPARVLLMDVDGSGTMDLVHLDRTGCRIWFNRTGSDWSDPVVLPGFPATADPATMVPADLFGKGTTCLLLLPPAPGVPGEPVRYVDLISGPKPHLLTSIANNLGAETRIEYTPSTTFALADEAAGQPWLTRLPFPVHCVTKVTTVDAWRASTSTTTFRYRHGHYDGREREFRGFGCVERIDVESFGAFARANAPSPFVTDDQDLYQPPTKTVTWYHTGATSDDRLPRYDPEFLPRRLPPGTFHEKELPDPELDPADLGDDEWREAMRACKGRVLRVETYELDPAALERGDEVPTRIFSAVQNSSRVQRLQPRAAANPHAVFLVTTAESLTYQYELDLTAPGVAADPRVVHELTLRFDDLGNPLQAVTAVYPRPRAHTDPALPQAALARIAAAQGALRLAYVENRYTGDWTDGATLPEARRLRELCETRTCELTGIASGPGGYLTLQELRGLRLSKRYQAAGTPVEEIPYHRRPSGTAPQLRLVDHVRTLFFADDLSGPRPFAELGRRALTFETYRLALSGDLLHAIYREKLTPDVTASLADPARSGYLGGPVLASRFADTDTTAQFWIRTGTAGFGPGAATRFYLPERYKDAFGNVTVLHFDSSHQLYLQSSTDPAGNTVQVDSFDFRVLGPCRLRDANDNLTDIRYDTHGFPIAVAQLGKGTEGDDLTGFADTVDPLFFTAAYDEGRVRRLLGNATSRFVYHFGQAIDAGGNVTWASHPACAATVQRETHQARLATGELSRLQVSFEYSDGSGAVLVTKNQAEPAPGQTTKRWIANGRTVLNNKGQPVKQYEPYFSPAGHHFEEPQETGVSPTMRYDALGRLVRTDLPDGTFSTNVFSPWHVTRWDACDTVLDSRWYADRGSPGPGTAEPGDPQERAAWLAVRHANTPTTTHLDSAGREVVTVEHNRAATDELLVTCTELDVEGKVMAVRDPRGNLVMQCSTPIRRADDPSDTVAADAVTGYDLAGGLLFKHSMDGGDRWTLNDAAGRPMFSWDSNLRQDDAGAQTRNEERRYATEYDSLRRPVAIRLAVNGAPAALVERFVYGEGSSQDRVRNLRGRLYQHDDPSGRVTVERMDFAGRPVDVRRTLARRYDAAVVDWSPGSPTAVLEGETYTQLVDHDALGRVTRVYRWHRGTGSRVAVEVPRYNERGLVAGATLQIGATKTAGGHATGPRTVAGTVTEVRYDAKGRRTHLSLGNNTLIEREYDPLTFRLRQIRSTRPAFAPDRRLVQSLTYTFDPVGNITEVSDQAYEPVFFDNQRVPAVARYTYDALYRLIRATGREDAALTDPPDGTESPAALVRFPVSGPALRGYTQTYDYDQAGNIATVVHRAGTAGQGNWTRHHAYAPDSNRLARTWFGTGQNNTVSYRHDPHGNILNLSEVREAAQIRWDHRDMPRSLDLGGGWAYYAYDSEKQRTRTVVTDRQGNKRWERLYFGDVEIYRVYRNGAVTEEIDSLPLTVAGERILLVDDVLRTPSAPGARTLFRYQYADHLGSACLELDDRARIISYEEYHPYGTTAYRARDRDIEVPRKRYRHSGTERDDESGLDYHQARFYVTWLGRWLSPDPAGIADSLNRYRYPANPLRFRDPGGREIENTDNPDDFTTVLDKAVRAWESGTDDRDRRLRLEAEIQKKYPFGVSGKHAWQIWANSDVPIDDVYFYALDIGSDDAGRALGWFSGRKWARTFRELNPVDPTPVDRDALLTVSGLFAKWTETWLQRPGGGGGFRPPPGPAAALAYAGSGTLAVAQVEASAQVTAAAMAKLPDRTNGVTEPGETWQRIGEDSNAEVEQAREARERKLFKENMKERHGNPSPGEDDHHIVPFKGGGEAGEEARQLLSEVGIETYDAENGARLSNPQRQTNAPRRWPNTSGQSHANIHTEENMEALVELLRNVRGNRQAVINTLQAFGHSFL